MYASPALGTDPYASVTIRSDSSDIGYAVAVEFWGQGVATKAVKIALKLQAYVDVQNKASQRSLLRKYSYVKGQIRYLYLYRFLSTDRSDTLTGMLFKISDGDDFMTWAGDGNVTKSHARCMAIYINDRPVGSMEGRDWVCSEPVKMAVSCLKVWLLSIDVNVASQRVLGKAGVVKEGVRKKFLC
ncbi:hypothetical protein ACOSQ4_014981 [Xanthoceras sorbifolium]